MEPGLFLIIQPIQPCDDGSNFGNVSCCSGFGQSHTVFGCNVLPDWQSDATQVLRLEAQRAAVHLRGIGADEQMGYSRHQNAAKFPQRPVLRRDVVEIVVGVEPAIFINDVGRTLDIRNQQLWRPG